MDASKCCYQLKIKTDNAIRTDWQFPTPRSIWNLWNYPVKQILTEEWIEYIKNFGFDICAVLLFYKNYNGIRLSPHIDTDPQGISVNFALNWCIGGEQSYMVWYNIPKNIGSTESHKNLGYESYSLSGLEEIDRSHISNNLALVRTNVPHTISMGASPRWCFTCRTVDNLSCSWEEIVTRCQEKNLIQ
jgi:hypothetical protein